VNTTDLILLVLLFLFGLRGYFRGLFRESFSLLGLSIGLMVAIRFDDPLAGLWSPSLAFPEMVVRALAFVTLFAAVYFGFCLSGWLLHQYAKRALLGSVDRAGGILLAFGKGAVVLALIVFFLISTPLLSREVRQKIEESYVAPILSSLGRELYRVGKGKLLANEEAQAGEGPP
jgi:membrane protein required for colicin V production